MKVLAVRRDVEGRHLGKRSRPGVLVGQRLERHGHPDHRPDQRPPDAGGADDDVGLDLALVGDDRPDSAVVGSDAGDGVVRQEPGAALGGPTRLGLGHPDGLRQAIGRDVVRADDRVTVDERPQPGGLVRVDDPALDAPRFGEPRSPMQFAQSVLGQGQLEAADLVEAPLAVELERARLLDRVPGELGHGLGAIGLEHEPGRVRGRAAGREQRPLLDDDDVGPAAHDELVGQRTADDAGTDDRDVRARRQGSDSSRDGNGAGDRAIADPAGSGSEGALDHGIQAVHFASFSATHLSPASSALIPWLVM